MMEGMLGKERRVTDERLPRRGLFHLCMVYVLWSTTYTAMRIGVRPSSGFPPFIFGALRFSTAALILLAMARVRGLRLKPTRAELISLCIVGNVLWLGGHGSLLWASQYADSGFICLMSSSVPIWTAVISLFVYRKRLSLPLVISLIIGFGGIAVLCSSSLGEAGNARLSTILALVIGPFAWALGSAVQVRRPTRLDPLVMSGYHQLAAGFGFLAVSLLLREPPPHPVLSAWAAWAYLVVFGSVFAFTSFVVALKLLPINIAMTYAYVNPVLALFLGWALLGESITPWVALGAGLVIMSVFTIFHVRERTPSGTKS
jgi:drug/metabolite transporter (DMT)-like permease